MFIDEEGLKEFEKEFKGRPNRRQVLTAQAWIRTHCIPRMTFCSGGSYGLKHRVEDWALKMNKKLGAKVFESYISNGAFIWAAFEMGYKPKQIIGTKNAKFNFSIKRGN